LGSNLGQPTAVCGVVGWLRLAGFGWRLAARVGWQESLTTLSRSSRNTITRSSYVYSKRRRRRLLD
jgi:hypothetical protein